MTKLSIPHIHKIEGDMGFVAKIVRGRVREAKIETLLGLREIEKILVDRPILEIPTAVARTCGICPIVHTLNSIRALEDILGIRPEKTIEDLRRLLLASQIIHSHTLHIFFMSLPDFFKEKEIDLSGRLKSHTKKSLKVRDFALRIVKVVGGRTVHPIRPQIGGFTKLPEKDDLKKLKKESREIIGLAGGLGDFIAKIKIPELKREGVNFLSLKSYQEYPFYQGEGLFLNKKRTIRTDQHFQSLKNNRFYIQNQPYMLGAIARLNNYEEFLNPKARRYWQKLKKQYKISGCNNIYLNFYAQMVEIIHFLEETARILSNLEKVNFEKIENKVIRRIDFDFRKRESLSVMEAPRGILFTYFKIDKKGIVKKSRILTPSVQFLNNMESDLKALLNEIKNQPKKVQTEKIKSLIRVYDPCISCAVR